MRQAAQWVDVMAGFIGGERTPRRNSARQARKTPIRAKLAPVAARDGLQERVYRELRKALIYGKFDPGQTLTIHELANSLETSTMPVRDALARLVSEQALEAMPNRSVRVPRIDAARVDDLLRARVVTDVGAACWSSQRQASDAETIFERPLRATKSRL